MDQIRTDQEDAVNSPGLTAMQQENADSIPVETAKSEKTVLLTSYFTSQRDHHHECQFPSDAPELLLLAKTAERQGVDCLIFYDALSERFVREHMSRYVTFVKVPPPVGMSNNDYRIFVYRDWLATHRYESVWCCDLFDVRLNRNPASLLDQQHDLWIGIHRDWTISDSTEVGRWMIERFLRFYPEVPEVVRGKPVLMAGTFGGYCDPVRKVLELLTGEHERCNPGEKNYDMALFNLVAHRDLGSMKVWTNGAPMHSEFRAYDSHADVCFVHK